MNNRYYINRFPACFTPLLISISLLFCSCTMSTRESGNASETFAAVTGAENETTETTENNNAPLPYGLGTTLHINGFDITFEGLTGELCSPLLQFSIRTDNELFCSRNPNFDMTVYPAIEEQEYADRTDNLSAHDTSNNCLYKIVTATQNVYDPHLYTAWTVAKPTAMTNGQTFVVSIRSIRTGIEIIENSDGKIERSFDEEIILDAEWKISFPQYDVNVLRNPQIVDMKDCSTDIGIQSKGNYDVEVNSISFFINSTEVFFDFNWSKDKDCFFDNYDKIEQDILKITGEPKLIIDGIEVDCSIAPFLVWMSPDEYPGIVFTFPSIYYEKTQSIVLVCGDTNITIK